MLDALFANGAWIFSVPALLGTGIFLIKLVMMLIGGSDDLDLGGDASSADAGHVHDVGMDGSHGDAHHGHAHNALMAVASVQGVSAFAMGFGWAGLGALNGMKWGMAASMGVGVLGGVGMAALFVLLLALIQFYRYNTRLAAHYDARADVIELVQSDDIEKLVKGVEMFSPDVLDFGKSHTPSPVPRAPAGQVLRGELQPPA